MYDRILVKKISCPQCGEDNDHFEFQSESFKNYSKMQVFNFPDFVMEEDGSYPAIGVCLYCSGQIQGKVLVKNNLMIKITYWVENCPVKNIQADFESAFREIKEYILKKQD